MQTAYDFAIVGGGPGGYTAALQAAARGATVALVEEQHLGGVCLNWGCIPTKALLASSKLYEQIRRSTDFGIKCESFEPDLPAIIMRKDKLVSQLRAALAKLLASRQIAVVEGRASMAGPHRVEVEGPQGREAIEAKRIIIATGSRLADLPGLACDGQRVLDIKAALSLDWMPQRLVVVGAGVVGCEMAQHFSGLGSKVSLVEFMDRPLAGMLDADLERLVVRGFKKRNYGLHFSVSVQNLGKSANSIIVDLSSGERLECDAVLVAVGMRPNSKGLGLESLGVEINPSGHIKVDEHGRTTVETMYAVGDVTGIAPLAHFAAHMGSIAVQHALGESDAVIDQDAVPKAVFLEPELAWVGLSEEQARTRYGEVKTGKFLVRGLGRATAENRLDGLIKLVARATDDVLLGAHLMGYQADALIGEATLALAKGLTISDLSETIHAHPTYSEGLMKAAGAASGQFLH